MSRTPRRFPIAFRSCAAALAVVAVVFMAAPTGAGAAPSAQQVQDAKDRVAALLSQLKAEKSKLAVINAQLTAAAAEVDKDQATLEKVTADLLATQLRIRTAQARYDAIVARLGDRAATAFMNGPASNLDFILGATSLGDLSDRIEFVGVVAQSDADLAQEVASTRNELLGEKGHLQQVQTQQTGLLKSAQAVQQKIDGYFQAEQQIVAGIATKRADAQQTAQRLSKARQTWLAQQLAGGVYGGGHTGVPVPAGWEHVLERCPVDGPRSYSDDFGAPRYAGGFHLHAGVDILSPRGTPIVAPFDGTAQTTYNTLGGNSVYVYGSRGYVYNAHLSAYSSKSNGPVHTGDVIGYVGDTGDAKGTPHDHFEFHPNVIPSGWPASGYGYAVIGTAVNPYPLLVAACG
jgi:peptidoglycan hydrolase CwlO-like protein